ncbi:MAG: hypothetical protein ABIQ12_09485 [Opitutaceae bacterium]
MPLAEKSSATTGKNGSWVRAIRSDPTVQALQLATGRSRLETQFEPLCRSLGLTAQRREKFYANLMERDAKIADVQAATDAMDIGDDDNIMERLFREPMAACETAQRELLGEEGYRQAMEYLALAPAREMVRGLAVVATAAGVALSSQQMEQLVPLLRGPVGRSGADAFMVLENLDWTRLDASVRTVLTNEQFALFQRSEPSLRSSPSRFMRPLEQLIDRAREADAAEDAAKALPKRPSG